GSFRTHINQGVAADFANGAGNGQGVVVKPVVIGIDQVQTGPRRNGSTQSPDTLFFNVGNPRAARGNAQQGAVDQLSLLRFATSLVLTAAKSPTGQRIQLSGPVVFYGHSQGSTEGGIMLPSSGYSAALLAGQGASIQDALVTKTNPVNLAGLLPLLV